MLENLNDKAILASISGSLLFMIKQKSLPLWERFLYLIIGTVAAYLTSEATVVYLKADVGVGGAAAFFAGVLVIPVMETLLNWARDPSKAIDFVRGLKNGEKHDDE